MDYGRGLVSWFILVSCVIYHRSLDVSCCCSFSSLCSHLASLTAYALFYFMSVMAIKSCIHHKALVPSGFQQMMIFAAINMSMLHAK